jgi:hypothetical protein
MAETISERGVAETIERNGKLMECADNESRQLRDERRRSRKILRRARESFDRLARRNRAA